MEPSLVTQGAVSMKQANRLNLTEQLEFRTGSRLLRKDWSLCLVLFLSPLTLSFKQAGRLAVSQLGNNGSIKQ